MWCSQKKKSRGFEVSLNQLPPGPLNVVGQARGGAGIPGGSTSPTCESRVESAWEVPEHHGTQWELEGALGLALLLSIFNSNLVPT